MRPIKFRAWRLPDKENPKGWWIAPSQMRIYLDGDIEHHVWDAEWESEAQLKNCVLMQFTGFNDKNGKPIFEGDVVQWDDQDFRKKTGPMILKASVVFYWGAFRVEGKIPGDWKGCLKTPTIDLTLGQMHSICEVLGNIYENPDLLK